MSRALWAVVLTVGCAANVPTEERVEGVTQEVSAEGARIDTFADGVGRDLVDDSGSRWTYIGRAGSAEAAKRDPKWLNVTMAEFETLNTQEKAEFLRPEMMLRGHVYRMADESLSTGVPIDRPLEVVEPSLPEGSTEPMPSVFLRQTKVIFDTDSRSDASGSSHLFPWNTIGTVRTATGQGTGFKVLNHHTFVTAGHNFADPPSSRWAIGPGRRRSPASAPPAPGQPTPCATRSTGPPTSRGRTR